MQFYQTLTDDMLVRAYVDGDNGAFDALLRRHQSRVFLYILSIVKERELADDIFQETFIKAILTLKQGRYAENGKFSAWISRIARNLIVDYYRQVRPECASSDGEFVNRGDLYDGSVEDDIVNRQVEADVRRLVDVLPECQREVLTMRFYSGMSFKEIADATNVSINTALGRMRYALINMRRIAAEKNIALNYV